MEHLGLKTTEKPELKKENGFTPVDVVVNCSQGIVMRTSKRLCDEASKYDNLIVFSKHNENKYYDAKSILDLICMSALKEDKVQIKVEGTDITAEQIALRFYSAFASEDSFDLDFEKYVS